MTAATVRWLADRDGIAHAFRPWTSSAICGRPWIREQLAWPEKSRCGLCERRLRAVA